MRVGSGVLLGLGTTLALAGLAFLRDADALWLAADLALLGTVAAAIAYGWGRLRNLPARPVILRGWTTIGAAVLLLVALFVGLE